MKTTIFSEKGSYRKILMFHVAILIQSVVNQNKNDNYYNVFLEKGLHKKEFNT